MRFPNIMAMRTAKLKDWLLYSKSKNFSYHISCRDFLLNPEYVFFLIDVQFHSLLIPLSILERFLVILKQNLIWIGYTTTGFLIHAYGDSACASTLLTILGTVLLMLQSEGTTNLANTLSTSVAAT